MDKRGRQTKKKLKMCYDKLPYTHTSPIVIDIDTKNKCEKIKMFKQIYKKKKRKQKKTSAKSVQSDFAMHMRSPIVR